MTSFLSKFNKKLISSRENEIKLNLSKQLCDNVKEIQYEFQQNNKEFLELTDCTNSICTTLEGIFLHGLKDSFLWQTMKSISIGVHNTIDTRPNPNFWPLLLIFLHAHTIEQIESLTQITSDVGSCRCWIRLSLSESIFSSYLNAIRKNGSALNPYYHKYAFLKDIELIEIAIKMMEMMEHEIQIKLPINSSLLNQWTNLSLQIAGIWTPSIQTCPISTGIDVANSITDNIDITTPQPLNTNNFFLESISNLPNDLNDNENFAIFLQKLDNIDQNDQNNDVKNSDNQNLPSTSTGLQNLNDDVDDDDSDKKLIIEHGNAINKLKTSWSHEQQTNDEIIHNQMIKSRTNSMTMSISSLISPINKYSYDTLLIKYENDRQQVETAHVDDVWQNIENCEKIQKLLNVDVNVDDDDDDKNFVCDLDYEIVTKKMTEPLTLFELREMTKSLCKLEQEVGLDNQGFLCKSCAHPLGIHFANANVCAFTGNYFCNSCMSQEPHIIPAKIIYNFDFRKANVSKKAAIFLKEYQNEPLIDLKKLNHEIYNVCTEMSNLQSLRIQLNFIRAYLYTCCESIINEFHKCVEYKKYLYEHIHKYSINDLITIPKCQLMNLLHKSIDFGEKHISLCNLCRVKGFICEICNSPKVLYPFHLKTTFQCGVCNAVFHDYCLNHFQACPKCERKRKFEDLPLLDVVHML